MTHLISHNLTQHTTKTYGNEDDLSLTPWKFQIKSFQSNENEEWIELYKAAYRKTGQSHLYQIWDKCEDVWLN